MKKLLLIGGSGAIGQALRPYLKGYKIVSADSKSYPLPATPHLSSKADIVINLAGLSLLNDLSNFHLLNKKLINIGCLGAVNILAECLPHMREKRYGRIIMISSVCSEINLKGHGVYSASKAFVDKLVKIAALENAEYGITVNSIQLGYTGIGMGSAEGEIERMRNKPALKRFCTMQEVANAINFIIETEYFTGQNLRFDGFIK